MHAMDEMSTPHGAPAGGRGTPVYFESASHPGSAPWALVWNRAVVVPLACCFLPLMVLTLITMLQGYAIDRFLLWGYPVALVVSWAWARFRLSLDVVEVHVSGARGAVRSSWDVITSNRSVRWRYILDLRVSADAATVALGDASFELDRSDWPCFDDVVETLRSARHTLRTSEVVWT